MVINALKWLIKFLETRFPEKVDPATYATKAEVQSFAGVESSLRVLLATRMLELEKKVELMEKHIEILNLRVGLSRPTQMNLQKRV